MKTLKEYIFEKINEKESLSKKFLFSFTDLPKSKETIESLVNISIDKNIDYESSENSFEITINAEDCKNNREKFDAIQDILQQYSDLNRKDSKNLTSENFAIRTHKFMDKVKEMVSFIDDSYNETEESDEKTKKEDE